LCEVVFDGIDVYFDNVGGDYFEVVIGVLWLYGCVVLCGVILVYNVIELLFGLCNFVCFV